MAKYFRDLSYICIILFIVLGWHIMDNIVSEKEVDITSLEVALRSAGDNRGELEKVLCYYKRKNTDSLKYKAACYLIENMPFHRYSVGEQLENYKSYYAWLKKSKVDSYDNALFVLNSLAICFFFYRSRKLVYNNI